MMLKNNHDLVAERPNASGTDRKLRSAAFCIAGLSERA
jgi:hypothetical protein